MQDAALGDRKQPDSFARKFSPADVALLAELDALHRHPVGPDDQGAGAASLCSLWRCALRSAGRNFGVPPLQPARQRRLSQDHRLVWQKTKPSEDEPQDWRFNRPQVRGGGWPFQFKNSHYPDLDDTAAVAYAMHKSGDKTFENVVERAAEWICGMQSRNGGFASFDADNDHTYLNEIPFADHGALLDPPTEDVSGRCVMLLAQLAPQYQSVQKKCLDYLFRSQERDG